MTLVLRIIKGFLSVVVVVLLTEHAARAENPSSSKAVKGFSARTHTDRYGDKRDYVLFVPSSWQLGQKLPVLMFLNGKGQNGEDGVIQIQNNFGPQVWEMQEFFPFLAVASQCRIDSTWSRASGDSQGAMEILNAVIKEFGADEDRVYLTGVSAGGTGVWELGSEYADRFAAIAPLCGNGGDLNRIAKAGLPVWSFVNDGDVSKLVGESRSAREALIKQGQSPFLTEFHANGHDCWNAAYRLPALYGWLLEQRKSQLGRDSPFEYLPSTKLLAEWQPQGTATWKPVSESIITNVSGNTESLLISNHSGANLELHADVWLEAGKSCQLALLPDKDATSENALRIDFMPLAAGSGGVLRCANSEWLCGMDLAAGQSFKTKWWNDVRVRLDQNRLTIKINGWQAADVRIDSAVTEIQKERPHYRFAIVSPAGNRESRWRYVRVRDISSSATVP